MGDGDRFYVYVLEVEGKKRWYVGQTKNVQKRLEQHLRGETRSLKGVRIVRVLYVEEAATRAEAMKRERYLKSYRGRLKLARLLEGGETS